MNTNKLQRIIRVAGIAFSLLFGIGIFSSTTQAQYQNNRHDNQNRQKQDRYDREHRDNHQNDNNQYRRDDHDNYRYENNRRNRNNDYNNIYRLSVQHGYRDGLAQGAADARNGRRPNAQRATSRIIRQNGGNQQPTRHAYREGFLRGYDEGYNRYDNDYYDDDYKR